MCLHTIQIEVWIVEAKAVPGSFYYPLAGMPQSAVWAAEECDDYQGQQRRAKWWEASQTSDTSLSESCPPALMGCWLLIGYTKNKIWASFPCRKQHSCFTKAFSGLVRDGNWVASCSFARWEYVVKTKKKCSPVLCSKMSGILQWSFMCKGIFYNVYLLKNSWKPKRVW